MDGNDSYLGTWPEYVDMTPPGLNPYGDTVEVNPMDDLDNPAPDKVT